MRVRPRSLRTTRILPFESVGCGVVVKLPEETEDDVEKAVEKLREAEKAEPASDVCATPSPADSLDIPYPDTGMTSDTSSGSKAVKTKGGDSMPKGSTFQQSTGDEPGTSGSNVNKAVDTVKTTKIIGVPVWIWGVSAIALVAIAIIWLVTLNAPQLIEPVEQQESCLVTALP
jgi:hypothetical protein